jgi:hypothetical protein
MKTKLIALLMLVGPAWLLMPVEDRIHATQAQLRYGGPPPTMDLRVMAGQTMAMAVLAGFRGIVADFLWIRAHGYWEQREWLRQYQSMQLVTTLQPQAVTFWDLAAWHMGWNIAYAARTDPTNRTEAEGIKREREWHERARQFLEIGIANNPNRYELYFSLGVLYKDKFASPANPEPYCQAAELFLKAWEFEHTPTFVSRQAAFMLERCGKHREAYEFWKTLWADRDRPQQLPTVIERQIRELEQRLQIPNDQRVFPLQS